MSIRDVDLAYTAGIVDGEGCITITIRKTQQGNKSYQLKVLVSNTDTWVCQWLKLTFGGSVYKGVRAKPHYKDIWLWCIVSRQALGFLGAISPYLHIKKEQAEIAIRFQESKRQSKRKRTNNELAIEEAEKILLSSYK